MAAGVQAGRVSGAAPLAVTAVLVTGTARPRYTPSTSPRSTTAGAGWLMPRWPAWSGSSARTSALKFIPHDRSGHHHAARCHHHRPDRNQLTPAREPSGGIVGQNDGSLPVADPDSWVWRWPA